MKISGFTFLRNGSKLDFPFKESLLSILPLVNEFVIAFCDGDEDDNTLETIESISSSKVKIVKADWDPDKYYSNTLYAHLSDVAMQNCSGDWLFYLQGDEVVREDYLSVIKEACFKYLDNNNIEGLLFEYRHFWGDYQHYYTHHGWYPREIRIVRNIDKIHPWRDAQSFRFYHNFRGLPTDYLGKEGTRKLKVAAIPAYIFHYGWVRSPFKMKEKQTGMMETLLPSDMEVPEIVIDYGPLSLAHKFQENHPKVMLDRIKSLNWQEALYEKGKPKGRPKLKQERLKYILRSWIEINLLGGREIGGFKNYKLKDRFRPH